MLFYKWLWHRLHHFIYIVHLFIFLGAIVPLNLKNENRPNGCHLLTKQTSFGWQGIPDGIGGLLSRHFLALEPGKSKR